MSIKIFILIDTVYVRGFRYGKPDVINDEKSQHKTHWKIITARFMEKKKNYEANLLKTYEIGGKT